MGSKSTKTSNISGIKSEIITIKTFNNLKGNKQTKNWKTINFKVNEKVTKYTKEKRISLFSVQWNKTYLKVKKKWGREHKTHNYRFE